MKENRDNKHDGDSSHTAHFSRIPERIFLLYCATSCDGRAPALYQGRTDDIDEVIAFVLKRESCPYTAVNVQMITATESRSMSLREIQELKRHISANKYQEGEKE